MKVHRLGQAVILLCAWGAGTQALAQDTSHDISMDRGWYLGAFGGLSIAKDADLEGPGDAQEVEFDANPGFIAGGSLGYAFDFWRVEVEAALQKAGVDGVVVKTDGGLLDQFGGTVPGNLGNDLGDIKARSLFLNLFYDFKTDTPWRPFIGFGAGVAEIDYQGLAGPNFLLVNEDDTVFAYQAVTGLSREVSERITLYASYRYFRTSDTDVTLAGGFPAGGPFVSHSVVAGLRFKLGSVAPARPARETTRPAPVTQEPEPAPEPEPEPDPVPTPQVETEPTPPEPQPEPEPEPAPGPFLVFFDWDSTVITQEAMQILRRAAGAYQDFEIEGIDLVGHADRSGPEWYNDGLSVRRALAVQEILTSLGIPENRIRHTGRGETDPLVPTPDGVREPRNRRVEITLMEDDQQ